MKRTRFYSALPRVGRIRSNSLYTSSNSLPPTFFDSPTPPPPNTRNGPILSSNRLPIEARSEGEAPHTGGNPHAQLALAAPHPPNSHLAPAGQLALLGLFPSGPSGVPHLPSAGPSSSGSHARGRRTAKYTLEVGAYGIPKRHHHPQQQRSLHLQATDAPLAVQVGEDAYFVRENAMGVADGVGGWAKVKPVPPAGPSASALFARRLMHFCADEVDHYDDLDFHDPSRPGPIPVVTPWDRARAPLSFDPSMPASWVEPFASTSSSPFPHDYADFDHEYSEELDPEAALAAHLDALADGIDVLNILERAYERTLKAHVVPAPPTPPPLGCSPTQLTSRPASPKGKGKETIPLLAGSSTALVAVLDYVPTGAVEVLAASDAATGAGVEAAVWRTQAARSKSQSRTRTGDTTATTISDSRPKENETLTPVLKIAHVGDCMGMLVRDGEVVWRSEEMWWRWNTPVQLSAAATGGSSSMMANSTTKPVKGWWDWNPQEHHDVKPVDEGAPSSLARLFTLPVQAGDVLILASDGLSDNLWDEDVLEEVGRVGRAFEAELRPLTPLEEVVGELELETELEMGLVDGASLRRRTLAGMLSEALCSRARRVASRRAGRDSGRSCAASSAPAACAASPLASVGVEKGDEEETPFARRARETGRVFRGGKNDDISVIVAVIAPASQMDGNGLEAARAAGG
ncbi:phosphatase 2C-like domain-containing protein [Roridomyces roridus]|uniref:Protein phosphatase n=1 Tax=Roridomyces roridus TaxID=1738132 RepID=A0AAD7BKM9_9AGAR|nr:phosphatase 2C-like domain-containing protein [Roridomyces roridus]